MEENNFILSSPRAQKHTRFSYNPNAFQALLFPLAGPGQNEL
jgi:hypothetical protein